MKLHVWQKVSTPDARSEVWRFRVPGGWLYSYGSFDRPSYVPDPVTVAELLIGAVSAIAGTAFAQVADRIDQEPAAPEDRPPCFACGAPVDPAEAEDNEGFHARCVPGPRPDDTLDRDRTAGGGKIT